MAASKGTRHFSCPAVTYQEFPVLTDLPPGVTGQRKEKEMWPEVHHLGEVQGLAGTAIVNPGPNMRRTNFTHLDFIFAPGVENFQVRIL